MSDTIAAPTTEAAPAPAAAPAEPGKPAASTPAPAAAKAEPPSEDEVLRAIYRETMAEPDDKPAAAPDKAPAEPEREPNGQFKARNPDPAEAPKTAEPPAADEKGDDKAKPEAEDKPPPAKKIEPNFRGNWTAAQKAAFEKLPPEAQALTMDRQRAHQSELQRAQDEIRQLKAQAEPLLGVTQKHADHLATLADGLGKKPHDILDGLVETERTLRFGSYDQKLKTLLSMAKDYGINIAVPEADPLEAPTRPGSEHYPQFHDLQTKNAELQARLAAMERGQKERETVSYRQSVASFASTVDEATGEPRYPRFERLRDRIADVLEKGQAPDLHAAYEMAETEYMAEIRKEAESLRKAEEAKAAAQRAKRVGQLNVTSAAAPMHHYASEDDALRATYRAVMAS